MLVYVLAAPLVASALVAALAFLRALGRKVAAPTREEIREHDAYMRAWRTNRDREAWNRDLGIPAFGQKKAPAGRPERAESIEVADAILCRSRPR